MATTGTNLPRKLNPETGEWEVDQSQLTTQPSNYQPSKPTTFGAGSTSAPASGGTGTNPNAPVVYNAPQVAGSNMYNPNGDFVQGGPNPATYADNVAASGTQTATPTPTPTTTPTNSTLDWVNQMRLKYPQSDAFVNHPPEYFSNAIDADGGFHGGHDQAYWENRIRQGESYIGPGGSPAPWAPMLLPMMNQAATTPAAASSAPAGPEPIANISQDPFASMGGGVHLANGAWVPKGHPLAEGAALWQDTPAPTTPAAAAQGGTAQTPPVARTQTSAIDMLLNAGNPDASVPSTTNPAFFNPVDAEQLAQSPENAAFRLGAQRAEERQRAQLAERAAANGTSNSGGFENKLAGLRQSRGEQESQFIGQLAITKMQQAREDLVNGIQFAMANQQFDKAQAMQRELAQLNAALSREQMASTAATAARQIGSNETISANNLAENARQSNNSLGFNYASLQAQMNQYLSNLMLNGGG